jgi:hypothetical protein
MPRAIAAQPQMAPVEAEHRTAVSHLRLWADENGGGHVKGCSDQNGDCDNKCCNYYLRSVSYPSSLCKYYIYELIKFIKIFKKACMFFLFYSIYL